MLGGWLLDGLDLSRRERLSEGVSAGLNLVYQRPLHPSWRIDGSCSLRQ